LIANGYYIHNGIKVPVTSGLTATINLQLWSKIPDSTAALTADAQTSSRSCNSSSPQCCWIVESWQKMGKTTLVDPTSATACCKTLVSSTGGAKTQFSGIPGVRCTSTGIVLTIRWGSQSLRNSIPSSLGNLADLEGL
jgi:hypothetical protein